MFASKWLVNLTGHFQIDHQGLGEREGEVRDAEAQKETESRQDSLE